MSMRYAVFLLTVVIMPTMKSMSKNNLDSQLTAILHYQTEQELESFLTNNPAFDLYANNRKYTALISALQNQRGMKTAKKLCTLILEKVPKNNVTKYVNEATSAGITALHHAAYGIDIICTDEKGDHYIHGVHPGSPSLVQKLLDLGARVQTGGDDNQTPLDMAKQMLGYLEEGVEKIRRYVGIHGAMIEKQEAVIRLLENPATHTE